MKRVTIYDINGKAYSATIEKEVPIIQDNFGFIPIFHFPVLFKYSYSNSWFYKQNGFLHCEDGPARQRNDKTKDWYQNNKLHREDGPAIEYANGNKSWYVNDEEIKESDYPKLVEEFIASKVLV